MKKLASILVMAVTLIAIVFVAVFGTQPQGIIPKVYIETIQIQPSDGSQYNEEKRTMVLKYDENQEFVYGETGHEQYAMSYIFTTSIYPEDVTDRSFRYYIDEESTSKYMDFPPDSESAPRRGAFLVKRVEDKKIATVTIFCRTLDGGKAPTDQLTVVIDYRSIYKSSATSEAETADY